MAKDYQQDGFVKGFDAKALAEANRQLASAKNATPEALRPLYRSQIRSLHKDGGYAWFWVRAAAEDELAKVEQERHRFVRYTRAAYQGKVDWLPARAPYRVGIFDNHGHHTPKVVLVFAPNKTQEPSIEVFDAYEWAERTIREFSRYGGSDKEAQALVTLAEEVRKRLYGQPEAD